MNDDTLITSTNFSHTNCSIILLLSMSIKDITYVHVYLFVLYLLIIISVLSFIGN